ncbi:unnamed protein product [Fusarium langsethiae]|nr:unnamed protein product [Fusarium langsethiae]
MRLSSIKSHEDKCARASANRNTELVQSQKEGWNTNEPLVQNFLPFQANPTTEPQENVEIATEAPDQQISVNYDTLPYKSNPNPLSGHSWQTDESLLWSELDGADLASFLVMPAYLQ